jgi:uncharacterized protein YxeA
MKKLLKPVIILAFILAALLAFFKLDFGLLKYFKQMLETRKKDQKLEVEQTKLNEKANSHKERADSLEKEISNIKGDDSWHLRK